MTPELLTGLETPLAMNFREWPGRSEDFEFHPEAQVVVASVQVLEVCGPETRLGLRLEHRGVYPWMTDEKLVRAGRHLLRRNTDLGSYFDPGTWQFFIPVQGKSYRVRWTLSGSHPAAQFQVLIEQHAHMPRPLWELCDPAATKLAHDNHGVTQIKLS